MNKPSPIRVASRYLKASFTLAFVGNVGAKSTKIQDIGEKAAKELKKLVGQEQAESLIQNKLNRDKGFYFHVTIFSPPEVKDIVNKMAVEKGLSKSKASDEFRAEVEAFRLSDSGLKSLGLGKAEKGSDVAYFAVLEWPDAQDLRAKFGLGHFDFHTTIGFDKADVHGVRKDRTTLVNMITANAKRIALRYANVIGFHGWKMKPETMRLEGPQFSDQKPIPRSDVEEAIEWLDTEDPNVLVAYSRGGAVAMIALKDANANPRVVYVAPAWKRGWANISTPPKTTGEVIHGEEDNKVPLQHSCLLSKKTGLPLYVFPNRNHVSILKDKSNPKSGIRVPSNKINECVQTCPDWGLGDANNDDLAKQKEFVDSLLK